MVPVLRHRAGWAGDSPVPWARLAATTPPRTQGAAQDADSEVSPGRCWGARCVPLPALFPVPLPAPLGWPTGDTGTVVSSLLSLSLFPTAVALHLVGCTHISRYPPMPLWGCLPPTLPWGGLAERFPGWGVQVSSVALGQMCPLTSQEWLSILGGVCGVNPPSPVVLGMLHPWWGQLGTRCQRGLGGSIPGAHLQGKGNENFRGGGWSWGVEGGVQGWGGSLTPRDVLMGDSLKRTRRHSSGHTACSSAGLICSSCCPVSTPRHRTVLGTDRWTDR